MAYTVETGSRRFVGSGGVIAVHVALAYLLVFGLAPPDFIAIPEEDLVSYPIPPETEPPPPEDTPRQQPKDETQTPIPVPETPWEFPTDNTPTTTTVDDWPLPPIDPLPNPTTGGNTGTTVEPTLLTPTLAKPINDVLRWVTTSDYPRIAIKREEQGIARFSVKIDARGKATDCSIVRSSGSTALDEATCKNVLKRARFEPATDKYGAKVSGTYSNSVNWVLPE
jgi:protein TonB